MLAGAGSGAVPTSGCTLAPALADITVSQGVGSYSPLVRGKESLVRLYLTLPSCAVTGNATAITSATLDVTVKDASTGGTVGTQTFQPTPAIGTPNPQVTNLSTTALSEMSPSDPVFILPGSLTTSADPTHRQTLTFVAHVNWQSVSPSGQSGTANFSIQPGTRSTAITKTVERRTNALRLLVVPMGALLDSAATTAVENGMTTLSRIEPVPDFTGTTGVRVGSLTSAGGGIRYTINGGYLDLAALGIATPFCGTDANFTTIRPQLSTFLSSWKTANQPYSADNVVGVISESLNSNTTGCFKGYAALPNSTTPVQESWVVAFADKTTTLSSGIGISDLTLPVTSQQSFPSTYPFDVLVDNEIMIVKGTDSTGRWTVTRGAATSHASGAAVTLLSETGSLFAQEAAGHNYGLVPYARSDTTFHSPYTQADQSVTTDNNRAYNVASRQFLADDRDVMRRTTPGWENLNGDLSPKDFGYMLCQLGGQTTSDCTTSGTAGSAAGVAAGDSSVTTTFVINGLTNGTRAGTSVTESYIAPSAPTRNDPTSQYHIVQKSGSTVLRDDPIAVSFSNSEHDGGAVAQPTDQGLFSAAVPLATGATRIELRLGTSDPPLYDVAVSSAPTVAAAPITRRSLSGHGAAPKHGATAPKRPSLRSLGTIIGAFGARAVSARPKARPRHLAAAGSILRTITVSPAPSCGTSPVSVGVAFDGSELLVSCIFNNVVTRVDPATGANLGSYTITAGDAAVGGIGAMSWDGSKLWLAAGSSGSQKIYSVALNKTAGTGSATFRFNYTQGGIDGIIDGLAYDPTDTTLWVSPDTGPPGPSGTTIYHFSQSGALLGSLNEAGKLGSCAPEGGGPVQDAGNSGIAVAGTSLYLATDGCSEIYAAAKTGATTSLFASLDPKRVEDLEIDSNTFASQNKVAMWSKDAYDWELNAFDVTTAPANVAGPTIAGIAQDGKTLTLTSPGTWSGFPIPTLSVQWRRCTDAGEFLDCTDITGATGTTYQLAHADVGKKVLARVTAQNSAGTASADSNVIGPIVSGPVTYTFTDDGSLTDLRSDLLLDCHLPSGLLQVVAVALKPTVSGSTATFSYPQKVGCPGGDFVTYVYDGWNRSAKTDVGDSTLPGTTSSGPVPAAVSPTPGQEYSAGSVVTVNGSAYDAIDGTLFGSSLAWYLDHSGTPFATGNSFDLAGVGVGAHTITLRATNSASQTADLDIPITVSNDADGDGLVVRYEELLDSCAPAGSPPGDSDPTNGSKDYDNDGISNRDEQHTDGGPCKAESQYQAMGVIQPDPFNLKNTDPVLAVSAIFCKCDLSKITAVAMTRVDGMATNIPASKWLVLGNVGGAQFPRQAFIDAINARAAQLGGMDKILGRRILIRIEGSGPTAPYTIYVEATVQIISTGS